MLFGANKDKGLVLDGLRLKVVTLGEDGYTENDVLTHDAHCEDTTLHGMLAAMRYPDYPVALGVIRDVDEPCIYDAAVEAQVEEVKTTSNIHTMDELLHSGETWEVK